MWILWIYIAHRSEVLFICRSISQAIGFAFENKGCYRARFVARAAIIMSFALIK